MYCAAAIRLGLAQSGYDHNVTRPRY